MSITVARWRWSWFILVDDDQWSPDLSRHVRQMRQDNLRTRVSAGENCDLISGRGTVSWDTRHDWCKNVSYLATRCRTFCVYWCRSRPWQSVATTDTSDTGHLTHLTHQILSRRYRSWQFWWKLKVSSLSFFSARMSDNVCLKCQNQHF